MWGRPGTGPGDFDTPVAVAVSADGDVYVADARNHRVQRLSPEGLPLAQWGTHGLGPGEFQYPYGVAVDAEGYVYVSDWLNHRIQKFTADGILVALWGEQGGAPGQLEGPTGLAFDAEGTLYVAEFGNNRVQKFSADGQSLGVLPGERRSMYGIASAWSPAGVAVDPAGNVYVGGKSTVDLLSPTGDHLARWPMEEAYGIVVNDEGTIYATSRAKHTVQRLARER
jgi:tripartite motif-containing protein 71